MRVIAFLSLFVFAILAYNLAEGRIISLQGYIDFSLPMIFFWSSIFLICLELTKRDIGYLKIVTILLVFYSVLSLVLFAIRDNTDYEVYENNEHQAIVRLTDDEVRYNITVFCEDGNFFFKEIYQTRIGKHYEVSFEVIGNELIIERCNAGICLTDNVELE
jgi:hypothetical protein